MRKPIFTQLACLLAMVVFITGAVACGGGDTADAPPPPDFAAALADAPPALAALYENGDELVAGGPDAFNAQMEKLRGFPVVVNKWASWCGPCREEFPYFQELSAELGTRVAFVGVNGQDIDAAARTFLDSHPLPYPSFTDPDEDIIRDVLKVNIGYPTTVIFDAEGKLVHTKFGPYESVDHLRDEILEFGNPAKS